MRKLDIAFKRENSHNILLVKREDDMGDNYREKMILKNSIEGIARTFIILMVRHIIILIFRYVFH